ncbi:MAG: SDR family NAD(P)-dependent oxidoreductase [Acidimicrobiia bacterium]
MTSQNDDATRREFAGKVAIVTGAARGQGESHARRLVAEGAFVVVTDVLEAEGERLVEELGERSAFVSHDVTDEDGWARVIERAEAFGGVDILVNNAGIVARTPIAEIDVELFRRVLDVNVVGTALGMKSVVAPMAKRGGGSIVNVASIVSLRTVEGTGAYTASKWAVRGLTKMAAHELGSYGIRVNAVLPGVIDTDMVRTVRTTEEAFARNEPQLAIKRLGVSEDITEAVMYLASDRASYVTGADLLIDGGWVTG